VALQAQGTFKDIGAQAVYQNSEHRINWAAVAGHIPYLTGQTYVTRDPRNPGTQTVTQELDRIFVDQLEGYAFYPISQTRRFEVNGGYTRYSFDREINRYLLSGSGQLLDQTQSEAPDCEDEQSTLAFSCTPAAMNLFTSSAAFVGDNSYFGFTSPVAGQRFRVEFSPTFGSLNYRTFLADYRRYIFAKPTTFAVRALHFGRYGSHANDQRLSPLYLGYETLVRGYSIESFNAAECSEPPEGQQEGVCPEFQRLIGTRVGVASFEIRLPLIGTEELGLINFPFLPTEISPFFDIGVAWDDERSPSFEFSTTSSALNIPVASAGVSARFNVLGYVVLEAYYAYPFQRPNKGWHLGFNLAPGW